MCARKLFVLEMTDFIGGFYSGYGPDITLTEEGKPGPLTEIKDRWKVAKIMFTIPQFAFAGDFMGTYVCLRRFNRAFPLFN
jgi:hypothetical protein